MRAKTMGRMLVAATAVFAVGAGSLVTAGAAVAAPADRGTEAESVAPLAVNNLGLSNSQAREVQLWLMLNWTYQGPADGLMGTNTWKAMQGALRAGWGYTGARDGIVGPETIKALQRMLKAHHGYTGAIDGIAGSGTQAAFKRFANTRP